MSSIGPAYTAHSWMLEEKTNHAMISYHPQFQAEAFHLRDSLVNAGLRVFVNSGKKDKLIEKKSIADAESVHLSGDDNVSQSLVVVICLSNTYKASEVCKTEALRAVMLNKPLIIVKMESGCTTDGWMQVAIGSSTNKGPIVEFASTEDLHRNTVKAVQTAIDGVIAPNDTKPRTPTNLEAEVKQKGRELLIAAQIGDAAKIRAIVEAIPEGSHREALLETHSADPNFSSDTPLLRTARCGRVEAAELLIKYGAKLTTRNRLGNNALHLAAGYGHEKMVKLLLDQRCFDIDEKGQWGRTALHHASAENSLPVVKLLIESGANIEARGGHFDRTPLGMAAHFGRSDIAEFLCKNGANVEAADVDGETVLHLAATTGQTETARVLITKWRANPEARDHDYWTPLLTAAAEGHDEFVKMLLKEAAVDVFAQTRPEGHTVNHIAAEFGNRDVIEAVLDFAKKERYNIPGGYLNDPVDRLLNGKNTLGETPLHVAAAHAALPAVEVLIKWGAKLGEHNERNQTALSLARLSAMEPARKMAAESIIDLLHKHGAAEL